MNTEFRKLIIELLGRHPLRRGPYLIPDEWLLQSLGGPLWFWVE